MLKRKTVKSVLRAAAKLLDEHGLAKFDRKDYKGRLCVHGALEIAISGNVQYRAVEGMHLKASTAVYNYLKKFSPGVAMDCIPHGLAAWNNAPQRKKYQVVRALLRASELAS